MIYQEYRIRIALKSDDLQCYDMVAHQSLPGAVTQQDTVHSYLTDSCQAVLSDDTRNMHFQKSAYFPGEKITRTQMLVRVFTNSFT